MKTDGIKVWLRRGLPAWVKPKDSSETRFRQLFEKMPEPVWIVTDNHFVEANSAALAAIGYTDRPDFLHLHPAEVSPEYQPDGELSRTKAERMAQLGLEKGVHRFEWMHKRKDGSLFPVEVTLTSIDWLGKPSIYCTWRDISERKRQEQHLRLSQFSIDRATDAIYWINPDGRVFMANQSACAMLGLSLDELMGKTVPDIDTNFTPELWREHWEHLKQRGSIRLESMQPRADGTVFPVEVSANYIQFEGQEYNCAILRDISARKQAEESLRRIEFSVNRAIDALFWIRADSSFVDVNVAACESLGYSREVLLGLSVPEVNPAMPSDVWPAMWTKLETEKTLRFESVQRTSEGRDFPVEISASYFTFGNEALLCAFVRDISERKATEAELLQRTHLLESAQKAAHLGYYLTDLKTRRWTSSPMLDAIMGIDASYTHTVEGWVQLVHPEDRQQSSAEFELAVQRQEPLHHQYRIVRPCDGEIIWVDDWGLFEYDEDQPARLIGTVMDITERKTAELELAGYRDHLEWLVNQRTEELARKSAELEKTAERLQLAMEASNDGLWDRNIVTGDAYYSPGYFNMLGYQPGELPNHVDTWRDLLHPDDHKRLMDIEQEAFESDQFESEFRMRTKEGSYRWIHSRGRIVTRDEVGNPLRAVGTHVDITERIQAGMLLRQSEERFSLAMDATRDGLWDWNVRTGDCYYSPGWYRMLDLEPGSLPARIDSFISLLHPDERESLLVAVGQLLEAKGEYVIEFRMRHQAGSYIWVLSRGKVVDRDADGKPLRALGVHTDITERKKTLERLEELNQTLEQKVLERTAEAQAANQAKSQFLAHMSHEIRTPMNAVLGLAQLLEKEPLEPGELAMVRHIRESGDSLLHIINDILDFSKIEAGQLHLNPQPFTLSEVLSRIENLLRLSAESKGLALDIQQRSSHFGVLVGDPLRLEQVLINLTGNAIKFTAQGHVRLSAQTVAIQKTDVRVRFEVQDTGIGIAPDAISQLFLPFSQADAGITRRFGGTGLGLAISRRLVDLMGGQMGVNSEIGQGSTFWFELPFQPAAEQEEKVATIETKVTPPAGPQLIGLRVLAADDSRLNLLVVERALKLEGCHVTLAADGQQALQILKAQPQAFDVVLMDIQMPVMDGLTATREIRRDATLAHLPVIALTAGVLPEERQAVLEAGVNEFLAKPLDLQQMQQILSQYLCQ